MDIYLAGPLFTDAETAFNLALATKLRAARHTVFLPQQQCEGLVTPRDIFFGCLNGLIGSQIVVAVLDGADGDSGTCWECGYAYAKGMKVRLRTAPRTCGSTSGSAILRCRPA